MNRPMLLGVLVLAAIPGCSTREAPTSDATAGGRDTSPPPVAAPVEDSAAVEHRRAREELVVTTSQARPGAPAALYYDGDRQGFPELPRWGTSADRENYRHLQDNPVRLTARDPVSTFSIDVDTAAYSNLRRMLNHGSLPPGDAVRIEEMINYFSYDYPAPAEGAAFSVIAEAGPAPWHAGRELLHIGVQGAQPDGDLPPANLVFLIDVSGSMQSPDKLDLLKAAMKLLVRQLDGDDRIAIAVYAGSAGEVLAPTAGDRTTTIHAAIDRLAAGGSTNGGAGIQLAYAMARQGFIDGGSNRVILATDGDFNVGTTDADSLEDLVERQRASGVALTVLGFGTGNYNDALMQRLAQIGNGNAAYVDTMNEARKVLVDELASTLNVIAKDVKIQVEFNPAVVAEYRLLGYETRLLDVEDFNDDRVDAGEIGMGHTVTALYELTLVDSTARRVDPLRYGEPEPRSAGRRTDELAFVRLRHKAPDSEHSRLIEVPVRTADLAERLDATSDNFRFSAAVAGFGSLLRGGAQTAEFSYDDVLELARQAHGADDAGYRGEFLALVRTAQALDEAGAPDAAVSQR